MASSSRTLQTCEQLQQDGPVQPVHRKRLAGIPDRPFQVGDQLPQVCTAAHVAWLMNISLSQVHRLRAAHQLDRFLLERIGQHARFNGQLLQAWAEGSRGVVEEPRRFFGRKTFGGR